VNKVASKVELRFDVDGTAALDAGAKARLRAIARLDADGQVLVSSQVARDQPANLEDARAKLAALVARALVVPRRRVATRPTRGSRERRLEAKRRDSTIKKTRRAAWD
jgi:ribosome-associated protein